MAETMSDIAHIVNVCDSNGDQSDIDINIILDYLASLLNATLGASRYDLETKGSLLSQAELPTTTRCCRHFLRGNQSVIYVHKYPAAESFSDGTDISVSHRHTTYRLSLDPPTSPTITSSVAILNRLYPIDRAVPLGEQLQIINLPGLGIPHSNDALHAGNSPFQLLHSVVHSAITPYFEVLSRNHKLSTQDSAIEHGVDSRVGIPAAKKKLAELELSLLQLQFNAEIPHLSLPLHPAIQAAIEEAKREGLSPTPEHIPGALLADMTFRNDLRTTVKTWIDSVRAITEATRDVTQGSATQEVSFWIDKEAALDHARLQLNKPGIVLTLNILKAGHQFRSVVDFDQDAKLEEAITVARGYNQLFREFPLPILLSALSLEAVLESINRIFAYTESRWRRPCFYPVRRAVHLFEAISADLDSRVQRLVDGRALMAMSYAAFEASLKKITTIWQSWDDNIRQLSYVARERAKDLQEKTAFKVAPGHLRTQERLSYIASFRRNHEQLQNTILIVFSGEHIRSLSGDQSLDLKQPLISENSGFDPNLEMAQAYSIVTDVDVLDSSPEGTWSWNHAETLYNERTLRIETAIIARLRDRLATAKSANEMFRVFSQFNAFFVRDRIRGAIAEYQSQLVESVKIDIRSLQEHFRHQYGYTQAHAMAQLRDLPPVSGAILRARQIERRLGDYKRKIEDVLGPQWHAHAEGKALDAEIELFRTKLDTDDIYASWRADVLKRDVAISGSLFEIERSRQNGHLLELRISFDARLITLFKEVRNLSYLGRHIPDELDITATEARHAYPFAISLVDSVRIFVQSSQLSMDQPKVLILLDRYRVDVMASLSTGIRLKWKSFAYQQSPYNSSTPDMGLGSEVAVDQSPNTGEHVQFVQTFALRVELLRSKTAMVLGIERKISENLHFLRRREFNLDAFRTKLDSIQDSIDQLKVEDYANVEYFVNQINQSVQQIICQHFKQGLDAWTHSFNRVQLSENTNGESMHVETATPAKDFPLVNTLSHELCIRNQIISIQPPLLLARSVWIAHLQDWTNRVCGLRRIHAGHHGDSGTKSTVQQTIPFREVLALCARELVAIYRLMGDKLKDVQDYVDTWLRFQSLWDLQGTEVEATLDDDLEQWLELLQEMRTTRATFETSTGSRQFGPVSVDFAQAQMKINAKYDLWQDDMHTRFAVKLAKRVEIMSSDIHQASHDLQDSPLDFTSTAAIVKSITTLERVRTAVMLWTPDIQNFRKGQSALHRQRYKFSSGWIYVEKIENACDTLRDVIVRMDHVVSTQLEGLRAKVSVETNIVSEKLDKIILKWNDEKPVSGTLPPDVACNMLQRMEASVIALAEEADLLDEAKLALGLALDPRAELSILLEEVRDFKSVWVAVSTIWKEIDILRDTPWSVVQPRKVKQSLNHLLSTTKDMPTSMRQYAAFDHVQSLVRQLLKANLMLIDLKSDAVRERHWIQLFKTLKASIRYSQISLTLGNVWDLRLAEAEKVVRDIVVQAQGEMALEEFLKQVKELWQDFSLDLVNYQNKCRLIRGWDELFAKCTEHLQSLEAMKHSPYHKEFEDDAATWENRLSRISITFNTWVDVQRQWVYLEGVFMGNTDIRLLLPVESSRFQSINSEYFTIMKKVQRAPLILDVLNIPGLQASLERLLELLKKIQKSLGEYLERERASFPRFYFVGDEDLLEIIGNSSDTSRVARHIGKMFAGISSLVVESDTNSIVGVRAAFGEELSLSRKIGVRTMPKANEWLAALDQSVKTTLSDLLDEAIVAFRNLLDSEIFEGSSFDNYTMKFPAQIAVLAGQIWWTQTVETALDQSPSALALAHALHIRFLRFLAQLVTGNLDPIQRKKCEQLITEFVYQRDVIEQLMTHKVVSSDDHSWLLQLRFEYLPSLDIPNRLNVKMANATFKYGFEYLGVIDRLVRTPLTQRCYLTLTQALDQRLGGSPYGPAGTGKTETVKALGNQLGRFTIVFNCDDSFDFKAMGRIFLGICQVGAWGCFDEFNRLEERILSAVSQQIQNIQLGLKSLLKGSKAQIELIGRALEVSPETGVFITMNPGYRGRSNLPDNLKKLFRSIAMSKPDKELIAEVTLYSQGLSNAREISKLTVPFFDACAAKMTKQSHYDFGLRALKSVLTNCGSMKRASQHVQRGQSIETSAAEKEMVLCSLHETIIPKLVREDVDILGTIEAQSFPGVQYLPTHLDGLQEALEDVAKATRLVANDDWMSKAIQVFQIQEQHHGVMLVGAAGCGKTATLQTLSEALHVIDGIECILYTIDPKVMSKEALYGTLDSTTREWSDGLFTGLLRKIIDDFRGESHKRHWIVFDGDVDPEWVESLNSVLDDNRMLTLPNGERLALPGNVRIMFEVDSLHYATLATVSRCGMIWFNDDNVTTEMMFTKFLDDLRSVQIEEGEVESTGVDFSREDLLKIQTQVASTFADHLGQTSTLNTSLDNARNYSHVMEFSQQRALNTLFGMLRRICRSILLYCIQHADFQLDPDALESFVLKKTLLSIIWSFAGDCTLDDRQTFGVESARLMHINIPGISGNTSVIDFDVQLPNGDWTPWTAHVPAIEISTHSVSQADIVIPTLDTVRHEDILAVWLAEHKPLVLCGPPGSGKTMTLFSALRKLPDIEVIGLNFSSATTPDLLLRSIEQHCEYRRTREGVLLGPAQPGRWIVVFCDEINLPSRDKYGTQRVITFLRQLVERNGFWKSAGVGWVTLNRIQFVGACNPPTDSGRVPLSSRFLRHAPVIMVDYPGSISLKQIYGAMIDAALKVVPPLRGYASALTDAMIELYTASRLRFTPDIQAHYVYSPRELTRWVRGIFETIRPLESLSIEDLVRTWAHEALRLFQDRLLDDEERLWTEEAIRRIGLEHFPNIDAERTLQGPLLFSNWLSKHYMPVERGKLREFVKARLRTFCEEEVDVPLVLYDDALDHILRIDRVFRQPQGHVILIGVSGSGKTTLSKFVAWINGLKVFQIKVHGKYSASEFDDDLRNVLRRCACKGEKIAFIMDESNVLDSAFLERMNTLLANAEVPGLFEGDEFTALMNACKEGAQRQGLLLDSHEELYKWFTTQIMKNLHVVFTMNPPAEGLASRAATSPALFNRCVLNWFGDWSDQTLFQVALELTRSTDIERDSYVAPDTLTTACPDVPETISHRHALLNTMVYIHKSMRRVNEQFRKQQGRTNYLTPRHFLDFVIQFTNVHAEKREDLEDQQRHLNVGLDKLKETVDKVRDLRRSLAGKKSQLEVKDAEANDKLQKMIQDQQKAESTRKIVLEFETALEQQNKEIKKRREVVKADLARAEPAVLEAQKSVNNIKRQHLTEVRSMGSPPVSVKLALEAVCVLLGHKVDGWKAIQAIVRRDDFIANIVTYDNERRMTPVHRAKMRKDYLSLEELTYERVYRASKACGPLVQWVEAQVNYSEILESVGPLRQEVANLEEQRLDTEAQTIAVRQKIGELEASISIYKKDYASLVGQTEAIKTEMLRIQQKVDRSLHLLENLGSERKRWDDGSRTFDGQIDTIAGDTLIAAAFLTYSGYYDQQYRKSIMEDWLTHLTLSGIKFRTHNPMTEYLSTADERLNWQRQSLPSDELCTENTIMLQHSRRYPLIIDPTGRIVEFLRSHYQESRITVSSFLDANFIKQLESALRFGGTILLQNAEHLDPILNSILNYEYQKTGGRILVQLGKQEIDFSPKFKLLLSTRDPSAKFSPDICSRTTLVNFTLTQSSLYSQSLDRVLRSERPDVDERRSNLIRLQGEFALHLRQLERRLLQALNDSKGNILDDDTVIATLESVKKEVNTITIKAAETDGVMEEVEKITSQYSIVAQSCSAIFAVLEQLRSLNHFYQFSLQYFVDIFQGVLQTAKIGTPKSMDVRARVRSLVRVLFLETFRNTSISLLQRDRTTFAMLLAQAAPYAFDRGLFDLFLDEDLPLNNASTNDVKNREAMVSDALQSLILQKTGQMVDVSALNDFLLQNEGGTQLPSTIHVGDDERNRNFLCLILVKSLSADRLIPAATQFINEFFGTNILSNLSDLDEAVDKASMSTPISLCCSPGFDASFRVDNLVSARNMRCISVAMGSAESLDSADKAISQAASSGSWVLLKNVHLAIDWLRNLEKRLESLKPLPDFRLFLSMECSTKIPINVIRLSRIIMCEQPIGLRASIRDSTGPLVAKVQAAPAERGRLHLLLALVHAVIQERLRYVPALGWNAHWEINESDFECALHVVDVWLARAAGSRTNIAPSNIPWAMLRALVLSTYGGKMDSDHDLTRLARLINSLFVPEAFEDAFDVVQAVAGTDGIWTSEESQTSTIAEPGSALLLPTETSWNAFKQWINELPEREPPEWLGLPPDAEKVLLVESGKRMVDGVRTVVRALEESEVVMAGEGLEGW